MFNTPRVGAKQIGVGVLLPGRRSRALSAEGRFTLRLRVVPVVMRAWCDRRRISHGVEYTTLGDRLSGDDWQFKRHASIGQGAPNFSRCAFFADYGGAPRGFTAPFLQCSHRTSRACSVTYYGGAPWPTCALLIYMSGRWEKRAEPPVEASKRFSNDRKTNDDSRKTQRYAKRSRLVTRTIAKRSVGVDNDEPRVSSCVETISSMRLNRSFN